MDTSSIPQAQSNATCAPGGAHTNEQQSDMPTPAQMGHRQVSATTFLDDVAAYHKQFREWNCARVCRTALKALADYVILPVIRAGIFTLGCLFFPLTMILGMRYHDDYKDDLTSEAVAEYMEHNPGNSLDVYASHVRIAADQLDEKMEHTLCKDICCDLILPWLFIPLSARMLVKRFDIWCGAASKSEEQYIYSKKAPLSEREKRFFSTLGYSDKNLREFPETYSLYRTNRIAQTVLCSDRTDTSQHSTEEDESPDSTSSLAAGDQPPSDRSRPGATGDIVAGQVAANQKSAEALPADDPASPADKQDKQDAHDGPSLVSATLNPPGSPAAGDQPAPDGSQTGDAPPPKATA